MAVLELFVSKAAAPPISPALRMVRGEFALMFPTIVQSTQLCWPRFYASHLTQWQKRISWKKDEWQQVLVRNAGPQPVPPKPYTTCWILREKGPKDLPMQEGWKWKNWREFGLNQLGVFAFTPLLLRHKLKTESTKKHGEVQQIEQGSDFHPPVKKQKNTDQKRSLASLLCCVLSREATRHQETIIQKLKQSPVWRGNINR